MLENGITGDVELDNNRPLIRNNYTIVSEFHNLGERRVIKANLYHLMNQNDPDGRNYITSDTFSIIHDIVDYFPSVAFFICMGSGNGLVMSSKQFDALSTASEEVILNTFYVSPSDIDHIYVFEIYVFNIMRGDRADKLIFWKC